MIKTCLNFLTSLVQKTNDFFYLIPLGDRQVNHVLKEIGLKEKFDNQELLCDGCGTILTLSNLGTIIPAETRPRFVCDNLICSQRVYEGLSWSSNS